MAAAGKRTSRKTKPATTKAVSKKTVKTKPARKAKGANALSLSASPGGYSGSVTVVTGLTKGFVPGSFSFQTSNLQFSNGELQSVYSGGGGTITLP